VSNFVVDPHADGGVRGAAAMSGTETSERERRFWNEHARESAADPDVETYRVRPTDRYDPAVPWLPYLGVPALVDVMLDALGDLRDKPVLDLGTGTGFLAVLLALRGARVIAVDVSEEQLATARARARVSGVEDRVEFREMASEVLDFPSGAFAAVVGSFVLHHVDLARAGREIHRVLAPGARAAFIETSARNPLLMAGRTYLVGRFGITRASSPDEAPLGRAAERALAQIFPGGVRLHYPDLLFLRMLPAYVEPLRRPRIMALAKWLDERLWRIPRLRPWSYFVVVELRKPGA
jgi:ubiquinone/menaquinone biosynthesis C-methylase UbiE